jgi:hypothetical protein
MTAAERHVLEHSTGWLTRQPLYRNHFCASEGHHDWETIQSLCARGLMRVGRKPSPISGGDTVFVVTDAGVEALRALALPRKAKP